MLSALKQEVDRAVSSPPYIEGRGEVHVCILVCYSMTTFALVTRGSGLFSSSLGEMDLQWTLYE